MKSIRVPLLFVLFGFVAALTIWSREPPVESLLNVSVEKTADEAAAANPSKAPEKTDDSNTADAVKSPEQTETSLSAESAEEAKTAAAAAAIPAPADADSLDTLWVLLASTMVFFMQLGFMLVEVGFSRSKNAINITMKNVMDFAVGSLAFYAVGFGLMWGLSDGGFCGTTHFLPGDADVLSVHKLGWTFFLFQTVFCATAATIVSGSMAERTKFPSYLLYSLVISIFIYPVLGAWTWGGGWLAKMGFHDFAGSTVVHSLGGWLALAGAMILGPRIGKYSPNGAVQAIPGHHIPMGALGVLFLWFGWFGFNPGSTCEVNPSIGFIAITTNLAAAAGAVSAMGISWIVFGKSDATMTLNGILAGLVAVTAGCDVVSPAGAILIGAAAGALVIGSILFIDRVLKIDDPVGAVSVHGMCGVFGTICVGLFAADGTGLFYGGGTALLKTQLIGALACAGWGIGCGLILFTLIRKTVGLRVSRTEELRGLDIEEHGMQAYPNFDTWTTV